MQANKFSWVFIPLTLCSNLAIAGEMPTVGDLAHVQAETILIRAQAKREEAQADLALHRQGGASGDGTLPVLKSIYGTESHLVATFIYPGNLMVDANEGDLIPNGYRVRKIYAETSKVELAKGKDKFQVGFSASAPFSRQQLGQSTMGVAPFVPGINR